MDPLGYALPLFVLACAAEAIVLRRRRSRSAYRLADFASGVSCGILDQTLNLGVLVAFLTIYDGVQVRHGVVEFAGGGAIAWVAMVLAHDLAYYAFHRTSHRVNALWAAHVVHHQGEDYNFTVSLRQGTVATWVTFAFYLPLAVVGFPVEMFVVVHAAYQVYQFFVHTELVPRLGPLEWVLATPRHHRVHHGRNPEYIDRNYGGFFIVWDRLFGTFAVETVAPDVGSRGGIASWSPLWANVGPYAMLARHARRRRPGQRLRAWFSPPETLSAGGGGPVPRYDEKVAGRMARYVLLQLGASGSAMLLLLFRHPAMVTDEAVGLGAAIVVSLATIAACLDGRGIARLVERARLVALLPIAVLITSKLAVLVPLALYVFVTWRALSRTR